MAGLPGDIKKIKYDKIWVKYDKIWVKYDKIWVNYDLTKTVVTSIIYDKIIVVYNWSKNGNQTFSDKTQ